jgi:glycosyltransferase involved in cell wall biosynthesis
METDPTSKNPNDPLISILIYNYDGRYLRQCLDSIFRQKILNNFEIVLIDDASNEGSWDIVLEYSKEYPGIMSINRNKRILGPELNLIHCKEMAMGKYYASVTSDQAFLPDYIKTCVQTLISDPHAEFEMVHRAKLPEMPLPTLSGDPLVSILCYNYNYGRYLRQCLESVFAQTYRNLELCFSDNASTDESWPIALEFAQRYPDKMYITRNRKNFGPDANFANSRRNMQGKYYVNFCSDDVLRPEYVERCVGALEAHPNAGFALVNRAMIDEMGRRTDEPPFYNQSCIIPGEEQAAVYMMAGVNPSVSQIMYRRSIEKGRSATGSLGSRYYGTRILDFNITLDFDIAYIKEPLLLHRVHSQSDTNQADSSLLPVMGLFVLNHQFADIASVRNLAKVTGRLPKSIEKLAQLGVRYSVRSLLAEDERAARRYFHLAMAMNPELAADPIWKQLEKYWTADSEKKGRILELFRKSENLAARSISYDPPPGSILLYTSKKKTKRQPLGKTPSTKTPPHSLVQLERITL